MVAVIMAWVLVGGLGYFLYNQLDSFSSELPQYSARIRQSWERIQAPIIRLESNAQSATGPPEDARQAVPVRVQEAPISHFLFSNSESIGRILLAISFIPVLTYFMLTWKDHVHTATVQLFPEEHRMVAFRAIARISKMLRSFLVANLIVGLIGAASFTALFWFLGIANSYFIGVLCGFLSLIPSIGVLLALLPPIVGGAGTLHESGLLILVLGIVGIHVATIDFLYPKLVGTRVLLNPLAVILSLVFWAWIWGGVGLVLAIPIVAAAKIVCDHTDALKGVGVWLGT
jgi:predicted PurR-regulated permease PerM